jgi:hypothetical protein
MKLIPLVDQSALMLQQGRLSASGNGTGVDITKYEGPGLVLLNVHPVSGTTPTADFAIKESSDNSTFTAFPTALNATQVTTTDSLQTLVIGDVNERKQYLRCEATLAGTSPVYDVCALLVCTLKYK